MNLRFLAQVFFFIGVLFVVLGLVFHLVGRVPWIGRLPGDFIIKKRGFVLYIPLTTSLALSLVLSLLFNFFVRKQF